MNEIILGAIISLTCPKTNKEVFVPVKLLGVDSSVQPCDTCGSHGRVEIYFWCPACNEEHYIFNKEW